MLVFFSGKLHVSSFEWNIIHVLCWYHLLRNSFFFKRNLRLQCEERGLDDIDMGPDETELKLSDSEINSSNLREITRLKGEVNRLRQTTENYKNKVRILTPYQQSMIKKSSGIYRKIKVKFWNVFFFIFSMVCQRRMTLGWSECEISYRSCTFMHFQFIIYRYSSVSIVEQR